jgi:dienelactone hydrolase
MMFRDIVTRTDEPRDWPGIRQCIHDRIIQTFGEAPALNLDGSCEYGKAVDVEGLRGLEIRFEVVDGVQVEGTILFPPDRPESASTGVVCIHGTNWPLAHRSMFLPKADPPNPNRAYALELARRGHLTISVDQPGFAFGGSQDAYNQWVARFYADYPDWSHDGIHLATQQKAVSILQALEGVNLDRIACMGNSRGGRTTLLLGAFDERIDVTIASTGISPNLTNVYRSLSRDYPHSPRLTEAIARDGHMPFDYHELLALIAPRTLLIIEPFNDPYNPYIEATQACFDKARHVWSLLDAEGRCQMLVHGYGHGTTPPIREYAYTIIEQAPADRD